MALRYLRYAHTYGFILQNDKNNMNYMQIYSYNY